MKVKETLLKGKCSFSKNGEVHLSVPSSWSEMNEEQLRYTLWLLTSNYSENAVRMYLLMRFAGMKVDHLSDKGWICHGEGKESKPFAITTGQFVEMLRHFDYVFEDGSCDNRISVIDGCKAMSLELYELKFGNYLLIENLFQAYLGDPENTELLVEIAWILYQVPDKKRSKWKISSEELYGVFLWYRHFKKMCQKDFPHLFKPSAGGADSLTQLEAMNAQLRALTDGDVTKEELVKVQDALRALTELDAKAKEAEELQKQLKKK